MVSSRLVFLSLIFTAGLQSQKVDWIQQLKNKPVVDIREEGAKCNGTTDDTTAIRAALVKYNPVTVIIPTGNCVFTDTLTIAHVGISLIGQGQRNSFLTFKPASAGKVAILLQNSNAGQELGMVNIKDFTLVSDSVTYQKIGVSMVDVEENQISFGCQAWTDNSLTSVCLQVKGRQLSQVYNGNFFADIPISIEPDPRSVFSFDHMIFKDLYLLGTTGQPCIKIADNVNISNWTVEGVAFVLCSKGINWDLTTATFSPYMINIKNVRWEQSTAGSYFLRFNLGGGFNLQGLHVSNWYAGGTATANGFYLRNCFYCTIDDGVYTDAGVFINGDSSVIGLRVTNNYVNLSSTITDTGIDGFLYYGPQGGLVTSPNFGINTFTVNDSSSPITIPNNRWYSTLDSSGAVKRLISLNSSDKLIIGSTQSLMVAMATQFHFGTDANTGQSHYFSIPNNKTYAGQNFANTDSVAIASVDTSDRVVLCGSGSECRFGGSISIIPNGGHLNIETNKDIAGTCTFSGTTCTVTFTTAYSFAPTCVATNQTSATPVKSAPTTTTVVLTGGSGAGATDVVAYVCFGRPS